MAPPEMIMPHDLLELFTAGKWPRWEWKDRGRNIRDKVLKPFRSVPEKRIKLFAPNETEVVLFPPPFKSLEGHVAWANSLRAKINNTPGDERIRRHLDSLLGAPDSAYPPGDIDPARCLEIGHFGHGSDSSIVLDYRSGPENPLVLRFQLGTEGIAFRHRWVTIAPTLGNSQNLLDSRTRKRKCEC